MGSEKSTLFMITACLIGAALFVAVAAAVITENKIPPADDGNLALLPADAETFGTLGILAVSPQPGYANGTVAANTEQNNTPGMLPGGPESGLAPGM
jgi:hypothetical protein